MKTSSISTNRSLAKVCHRAVVKNWKTTTIGLVLALTGFVAYAPEHFGGKTSLIVELSNYIKLGGFAAFGFIAKDFDKNGEGSP